MNLLEEIETSQLSMTRFIRGYASSTNEEEPREVLTIEMPHGIEAMLIGARFTAWRSLLETCRVAFSEGLQCINLREDDLIIRDARPWSDLQKPTIDRLLEELDNYAQALCAGFSFPVHEVSLGRAGTSQKIVLRSWTLYHFNVRTEKGQVSVQIDWPDELQTTGRFLPEVREYLKEVLDQKSSHPELCADTDLDIADWQDSYASIPMPECVRTVEYGTGDAPEGMRYGFYDSFVRLVADDETIPDFALLEAVLEAFELRLQERLAPSKNFA